MSSAKISITKYHPKQGLWMSLLILVILAVVLAFADGNGRWLQSSIVYLIMLAAGSLSVYAVWKAVKPGRTVTGIALLASFIRLAVGVGFTLLLPIVGYQDNTEHLAGYIYTDAYIRDGQAWDLAVSGAPLSQAFTAQYTGDQYGGMLALSAFIYRFISPDAHRPILILVLGAAASAWGVLCLWKASHSWFGEKTARLAAWFFALYPESILLGSSQMREAIVIPVTAVAFYGLTEILANRKLGWMWMALSAILLFPIQPLVGFISFAVLFGVWLLDPATLQVLNKRKTLLMITLLVVILLFILLLLSSILANLPSLQGVGPLGIFLKWFQNNFAYQSYVTLRSSGIFQTLLDSFGEQWRWLIVLVYGIAQPVLPAIVGDPGAVWIMRMIGFLRAAGWYALALFLIYGTLGVFRSRQEARRPQLVWIGIISWVWIMVAALNAGADQWDNPRYRLVLLIWQVILAAWAYEWARSRKDAWLWRWLAVEMVFVLMFTEWYLSRYYHIFINLGIKRVSLITLLISALILVGGLVWDWMHRIKPPSVKNRL